MAGWENQRHEYAGIFQHAMFDYPREGITIIMKILANKNSNNDDSNNDSQWLMTIIEMIMMVIIVNYHH